jgi:hypothetical protein
VTIFEADSRLVCQIAKDDNVLAYHNTRGNIDESMAGSAWLLPKAKADAGKKLPAAKKAAARKKAPKANVVAEQPAAVDEPAAVADEPPAANQPPAQDDNSSDELF